MTGEFNSVAESIRADIIEARQNGNLAQLLSYSLPATEKSLGFGLSDPDLLVCLGRATLQDPVIEFKVRQFVTAKEYSDNTWKQRNRAFLFRAKPSNPLEQRALIVNEKHKWPINNDLWLFLSS